LPSVLSSLCVSVLVFLFLRPALPLDLLLPASAAAALLQKFRSGNTTAPKKTWRVPPSKNVSAPTEMRRHNLAPSPQKSNLRHCMADSSFQSPRSEGAKRYCEFVNRILRTPRRQQNHHLLRNHHAARQQFRHDRSGMKTHRISAIIQTYKFVISQNHKSPQSPPTPSIRIVSPLRPVLLKSRAASPPIAGEENQIFQTGDGPKAENASFNCRPRPAHYARA